MQRILPSNNSRGRQLRAIEVQSKHKGKIEVELHTYSRKYDYKIQSN